MLLFGLVIKHDKSKIFYFSGVHNNFNLELDLLVIGTPIFKPKTYQKYLGFYFDQHLLFKKHIFYYSTKALSTIKMLKKSITTSETASVLLLCYFYCYNRVYTKTQISLLIAMQYKATLWNTLPTSEIEALVGLILIQLHLKKLIQKSCLRIATLSLQYILISLLSTRNSKSACPLE